MELELQTEQITRRLSIMYHDTSALLNRTSIKRWLSELEKNVSKSFPDFVVLRGCCRYVLFELHRKEWCKYYFLSSQYSPNQPVARSHLVLSRYPLIRNETFSNGDDTPGVNHLVEIRIPFNDLPMRYEYEDLDVQQIDNETINILVVDNNNLSNSVESAVQNLTSRNNPPTIVLAGLLADTIEGFQTVEGTQLNYLSEAWELTEYTERTQTFEFDLINFD